MNQFTDPSDLLLEKNIISQEEKAEILAEIDKGFFGNFQNAYDLKQFSAGSNGLILPLTIGIAAIIITLFVILFSGEIFFQETGSLSTAVLTDISDSEWEILKVYMQEAAAKLENKNSEISRYQGEIIEYDRKLFTLRELLNLKKETESRLAAERMKLKTEGYSEMEIASKITILEKRFISELAPDIIEYYDLSITDLNKHIDQILGDKTASEEKLEMSLTERTVIISENQKLQEKVKLKENETPVGPEMLEAMSNMSEIASQQEQDILFTDLINSSYSDIFQNLDEEKYDAALGKIDELQNILEMSMSEKGAVLIAQLPVQIKIVDMLKEYTNNMFVTTDLSVSENSGYGKKIEEIAIITEKAMNDYEGGNSKLAESELRSVISSIPEISKAFSVFSMIKTEEMFNTIIISNNAKESRQDTSSSQSDTGLDLQDVPEPVAEENIDPDKLIFVGVINTLQFDRISFDLIAATDVRTGVKFYIVKKSDQKTDLVLGTGVITDVSDSGVSGKLESLFISSSRPEADDLIYIEPDVNN